MLLEGAGAGAVSACWLNEEEPSILVGKEMSENWEWAQNAERRMWELCVLYHFTGERVESQVGYPHYSDRRKRRG